MSKALDKNKQMNEDLANVTSNQIETLESKQKGFNNSLNCNKILAVDKDKIEMSQEDKQRRHNLKVNEDSDAEEHKALSSINESQDDKTQ